MAGVKTCRPSLALFSKSQEVEPEEVEPIFQEEDEDQQQG